MSQRAAEFRELTRERCLELLAESTVGRVAWTAPDGPQVLPVSYAYSAGEIVFRTSPAGVLAQLARRQRVAFEIDEIDLSGRTAWSVQVRGSAQSLVGSQRVLDLWRNDTVVPWAGGSRTLFIAISPTAITGRYLRAWS
jgi:uncharacterized protein